MNHKTFKFKGITCEACIKLITKKLSRIPGVASINADPQEGAFMVTSMTAISPDTVKQLFKDTHYTLVE